MRALATCGLVPFASPAGQEGRVLGEVSRTLDEWACGHVVLDAALTSGLLAGWAPSLRDACPTPMAVHAPCPGPMPTRSLAQYDPRDLRVAAPDRVERAEALAMIRPALDTASLTGAPAIVIEGGPLPMASALAPLQALTTEAAWSSEPGRAALTELRKQRTQTGLAAVDGFCFAVEALLPAVEERGLALALAEQRGPEWAGSLEELTAILDRFAGAPVGWWADPVGRYAGSAVLPAPGDRPVPPMPPAGVWWRLPQAETDLELAVPWEPGLDAAIHGLEAPETLHVVAADGGRVLLWHRRAWEAFAS